MIAAYLLINLFNLPILLENDMLMGIFRERRKGSEFGVKTFKLTYCSWFKSYLRQQFCCCCGGKDRDKLIRTVGNRRIERELDVTHFIRS